MGLPRLNMDVSQTPPQYQAGWQAFYAAALSPGNPASVHQAGQDARRLIQDASAAVLRGFAMPDDAQLLWLSSDWEGQLMCAVGLARKGRAVAQDGAEGSASILWVGESGASKTLIDAAMAAGVEIISLTFARALTQPWPRRSPSGRPWARVIVEACHPSTGHLMPQSALAAAISACPGVPWALVLGQAAHMSSSSVAVAAAQPDGVLVSAEPLGGPPNLTVLMLRSGSTVSPLWYGGGQQQGLRPGTVAKEPAAALAASLRAASGGQHLEAAGICRDAFERWAAAVLGSWVCHADGDRLPHMSLLHIPGFDPQSLQCSLWHKRIACGVGRCLCGRLGLRFAFLAHHQKSHRSALEGALWDLCKAGKSCARLQP